MEYLGELALSSVVPGGFSSVHGDVHGVCEAHEAGCRIVDEQCLALVDDLPVLPRFGGFVDGVDGCLGEDFLGLCCCAGAWGLEEPQADDECAGRGDRGDAPRVAPSRGGGGECLGEEAVTFVLAVGGGARERCSWRIVWWATLNSQGSAGSGTSPRRRHAVVNTSLTMSSAAWGPSRRMAYARTALEVELEEIFEALMVSEGW